jgi:hypothetical protein
MYTKIYMICIDIRINIIFISEGSTQLAPAAKKRQKNKQIHTEKGGREGGKSQLSPLQKWQRHSRKGLN